MKARSSRHFGDAALGVGLSAHVTTLEKGGSVLCVRHLALVGAWQARLEQLLGRPATGIELPVSPGTHYFALIHGGRAVIEPKAWTWIREAAPWLPEPAARAIAELLHIQSAIATPITDGQVVLGAMSVWGDALSELDVPTFDLLGRLAGSALASLRARESERERLRLEGAILTARLVSHELNNRLQQVVGYGDLLASELEGATAARARKVVEAAEAASETLARLQRIVRVRSTESGVGPMLDLEAATGA